MVIPTFNESPNLTGLLQRLENTAREDQLSCEAIIVDDDSPDGTGALAERLARQYDGPLRVRVLHRPAKLGLSSALYDGIAVAIGDYVATIDGDNSHDLALLPVMLRAAESGADVVIGSRYVPGGRIEDWPLWRFVVSVGATVLSRLLFRLNVKDPMSGFVLMRRDVAQRLPGLTNPKAYKFLLDLLVRLRPLSICEVPVTFRNRTRGDSKLTPGEIVEFVRLVVSLMRVHARRDPDARAITEGMSSQVVRNASTIASSTEAPRLVRD